jgi:two-component system phosphate regulon sensor histidine kinase PhoR
MTLQTRKTILATFLLVLIFGLYETIKSLLFPEMSAVESHVISTLVVGLITAVTAWYVIRQQTDLRRSEEESRERVGHVLRNAGRNEALLRSIVDTVDEGLVIIDRDSKVLLLNDAARRLLSLGDRTVQRLAEISRDPEVHRLFTETLASGQRLEGRFEARSANRSPQARRVFRLQTAPLRRVQATPAGNPGNSGAAEATLDGVVGTLTDISQVEMLERVRQEFLANVSHELRTPLAAITAYTETLLDGGLEDTDHSLRFLHTIQRNAARMGAIVNDIAELSAIEAGRVRLAPIRLALQPLVAEICTGLSPRARQFSVELINLVPSEVVLTADRHRLEQILTNLIDNAIKFNQPGGKVTVRAERGTEQEGSQRSVRILIEDTGPGIGPEHLQRVFERFYRVDQARSREAGGTGLGLAIVKHLVRAHGGEVTASSEVGVGSSFVVQLPVSSTAPLPSLIEDEEATGEESAAPSSLASLSPNQTV